MVTHAVVLQLEKPWRYGDKVKKEQNNSAETVQPHLKTERAA